MKLRFGEHTILYIGSINNETFIRHQAYCVVFNPYMQVEFKTTKYSVRSNLVVVPSLESHRLFSDENTRFLFIDPFCTFSKTNDTQSLQFENEHLNKIKQYLITDINNIDITSLDRLVSGSTIIDYRIKNASDFIKNNLHKTISTKEIVDVCFLSESRLQHSFKEQIGMSIRKYILWQRVVAATKSIVEGNQLTQAAYVGGFADGAHFTRTFKKMFGVPPSFFFSK